MLPIPWLEDFNDRPPVPPAAADALQGGLLDEPAVPPPPDPVAEAWNEGYLAGCRSAMRNARDDSRDLLAELCRRVAEIEERIQAIADQEAADMGGLLVDMLRHALPEDCPEPVLERLNAAIEAVRPVFVVNPKLRVATEPPGEVAFRDLPGLYRVLEDSHPPEWPIGVSWKTDGTPAACIGVLNAAIAKLDC